MSDQDVQGWASVEKSGGEGERRRAFDCMGTTWRGQSRHQTRTTRRSLGIGCASKLRATLLAAAAVLGGVGWATPARAFTYAAEAMEDWGSCEYSASQRPGSLSTPHERARNYMSELNGHGSGDLWWWADDDVWASDWVEDTGWGGQDNWYNDTVELFLWCGHGGVASDGWHWFVPTCHGNGFSPAVSNEMMRFGEKSTYGIGYNRWLILSSCHSLDVGNIASWHNSQYYGGDMIVGYVGTKTDSWTTDEVPADFVSESFVDNEKLKPSWFWAMEDFWIDDIGGALAAGASISNAEMRLQDLRKTWPGRSTGVLAAASKSRALIVPRAPNEPNHGSTRAEGEPG